MTYDVLVLGATVAGLTTARVLAGEGLRVLVLDPNVEQRSEAIGHGVASVGHASTVAQMRKTYGERVVVEHIMRNLRGMRFIKEVLSEAELPVLELGLVDRSLGKKGPALNEIAELFHGAGAQVDLSQSAVVSQAVVVNPKLYAIALRQQGLVRGADFVQGVTVINIRRNANKIELTYRNNLAWARELTMVKAAACVDTLGVTPWGAQVRVADEEVIPLVKASLAVDIRWVELHHGRRTWMVRPYDEEYLIVGNKVPESQGPRELAALIAELEGQGARISAHCLIPIDPSDEGRPVVGPSAIPRGYYARGNGRGELPNGTAAGYWLAETLLGQRGVGALSMVRRSRARIRQFRRSR